MDKNKISGKSIATVVIIILLAFFFVFQFVYKPNYENLGGEHSWLSGSTLKFVNNWLEEGAATNRFTCYESFHSIEFNDLSERTPYVSYPTGSTFAVYVAAMLAGKEHIDISFLKHFQMICYALETVFFAVFVYLFLSGTKRFKEGTKTLLAIFLAAMWMLLPVNVYYLANVFFADQFVILWVMLFLLLEYINHMDLSKKANMIVNIVKLFVIYMGVMTDYYFWILVFVAFLMNFIRNALLKKKFLINVKEALWYVCPVVIAVATFLWQLMYTENWMEELLGKFFFRTGGLEEGNVYVRILINFYGAFTDANKIRLALMLLFEGLLVVLAIRKIVKEKLWKKLFIDKVYYILMLGFLAPMFQILFLKNHSAIHEFSMLKIGWIVIMSIPVMVLLLAKKKEKETVVMVLIAMLIFTGIPFSAKHYIDYRYAEKTYPLEEVLYRTMEYEHVCYSFTYEIPINPPQQLAVSGKQVYKVENVEEIDSYFSNLDEDAIKILVIEKSSLEKSQEISNIESTLMENNDHLYEDENYCLLELSNY